jgi:hypothetical protein
VETGNERGTHFRFARPNSFKSIGGITFNFFCSILLQSANEGPNCFLRAPSDLPEAAGSRGAGVRILILLQLLNLFDYFRSNRILRPTAGDSREEAGENQEDDNQR